MVITKDWDTKLIKMLHDCEAGEKAVITGETDVFFKDPETGL